MRFFFEVTYRGTAYHGWQIQKNALGVQEVINSALALILRIDVQTSGSGRTDKGVHAEQQFFHSDIETSFHVEELLNKLNKLLPADISVTGIYNVPDGSHARFDAIHRTYEYRITHSKYAFGQDLYYWFQTPLDLQKMNRAAKLLVGEKSFEAFSRVKTGVDHFICTITEAYWERQGDKIIFRISANRFLRGMVRAIVGTLIQVGQGNISSSDVAEILAGKDRTRAGRSVPAHGLYLCRVIYPNGLLIATSNG